MTPEITPEPTSSTQVPLVIGFPPTPDLAATQTCLHFCPWPFCVQLPCPCQLLVMPGRSLISVKDKAEACLPSREDVWARFGDTLFGLGVHKFVFLS